MQANVNLDALLEKMKAELERADKIEWPRYEEVDIARKCIKAKIVARREYKKELEQMEERIEDLKKELEKRSGEETRGLIIGIGMLGTLGIIFAYWGYELIQSGNFLGGILTIIVGILPMVPMTLLYKNSRNTLRRLDQEIKNLEQITHSPSKLRENILNKELSQRGIPKEKCQEVLEKFRGTKGRWQVLKTVSSELTYALEHIQKGNFEEAKSMLEAANKGLMAYWGLYEKIDEVTSVDFKLFAKIPDISRVLSFSARACDALYLGDVGKMRELLNEAREMLDERDKFVIGDVKFFKYLFEFHYFLLKAVVEAYEAEVGAVAKATQEQAERFAAAKPVEVPETVERVTVSAEEAEKELYRGEVRFKMGAMSQERVGTLVITNKRLKLTGKYRLRGAVPTVALKAALRAAGVGEVYEDIPLKEINFLELKKALLGGYYLEFKAKGKKYTIYTDAAQHIYNLLRQYGAEGL